MPFVADRRLYLTADGKVVDEDDPAATVLLVGIGGTLSDADVKRYGLTTQRTTSDLDDEPDEKALTRRTNKAMERAPHNKAG